MGFDHVGFNVGNYLASRDFYVSLLAPLDIGVVHETTDWAMFGENGQGDRAAVNAFHAAGLAAGGRDNGAPGLRPQYHPGYYAAFVIDPDGHNVEAVVHEKT